jgi:hypothetical protein
MSDLKTNNPNTYQSFLDAFCPPSNADIAIKLEEDDILCCADDKIIMSYLLPYLDNTTEKIERFSSPADYQPDNKWDKYKSLINTAFTNLEVLT